MHKVSPSDFAYLYEECKLCYCLKVKLGIYQPSMPMPRVFSAINSTLQGNLVGKNLESLSADLPEGEVIKQEGWVESVPVPETSLYIKGKYDLLVKNSDGTHTLVDLKISRPDEGKIDKYKTQLGAYKFALQNPRVGEPIKIFRMGLLIFYPDGSVFVEGKAKVNFPFSWLEIPDDEQMFFDFMKEVDSLLSGPLPSENINCKWCQYRHAGEKFSHEPDGHQEEIPF